MGWFWADDSLSLQHAPTPPLPGDARPPPGCPIHKSSKTSQSSIFQPSPSTSKSSSTNDNQTQSACPYQPAATTPSTSQRSSPASVIAALNPLNYMPSDLSSSPESPHQTHRLPCERETSSIPRGAASTSTWFSRSNSSEAREPARTSKWEYPSPQQMYNALLRKGHTDTDPSAVPAMVSVHNFLNEGAWAEIREWERRFGPGLKHGWSASARGEQGSVTGAMIAESDDDEADTFGAEEKEEGYAGIYQTLGYNTPSQPATSTQPTCEPPSLLRFEGRKDATSPKASLLQLLGWAFPSSFSSDSPFDRHDWYVQRTVFTPSTQNPSSSTLQASSNHQLQTQSKTIRYIIDYYAAPPEPTGEPVFYLDIRPALDGPEAAAARLIRWGRDVWWRASGGEVREKLRRGTGERGFS